MIEVSKSVFKFYIVELYFSLKISNAIIVLFYLLTSSSNCSCFMCSFVVETSMYFYVLVCFSFWKLIMSSPPTPFVSGVYETGALLRKKPPWRLRAIAAPLPKPACSSESSHFYSEQAFSLLWAF